MAVKIIDTCIEVAKSFEIKAKELGLDAETINECKSDIESQIALLRR